MQCGLLFEAAVNFELIDYVNLQVRQRVLKLPHVGLLPYFCNRLLPFELITVISVLFDLIKLIVHSLQQPSRFTQAQLPTRFELKTLSLTGLITNFHVRVPLRDQITLTFFTIFQRNPIFIIQKEERRIALRSGKLFHKIIYTQLIHYIDMQGKTTLKNTMKS